MNRMQSFEQSWAARHGVPVESMAQYRFESREGYRLPDMAAHYRTWCEALDMIPAEIKPERKLCKDFGHGGFWCGGEDCWLRSEPVPGGRK